MRRDPTYVLEHLKVMDRASKDLDPTQRFTERVAYYRQYRPGYPPAVLSYLESAGALSRATVVADIGSGTGLLTELFLAHGNMVYAVEPNAEMRAVAEDELGNDARFHSVVGRAEETTLEDGSIDLVAAGQAFHWFRIDEAREEFRRILRPDGQVALIYNSWNVVDSPIAGEYRALVDRFGIDTKRVTCQRRIGPDMTAFFGGDGPREAHFDNPQHYDFEALRGRALSSSYAPLVGHPNHAPFVEGLGKLFERHATDGVLVFPYKTTLYVGLLR